MDFESEPIMFQCMVPKTLTVRGLEATDFIRKNPNSMFCHVRFNRPMIEGDSLEIKVLFHDVLLGEGQCLLSITPPEFRHKKAKQIIKKNAFVVDPTRAWVSNLKDHDFKKCFQFGIKYHESVIQLRLPGDAHFFNFYHVQDENDDICVDVFFCEAVKSISLRDSLESETTEGAQLIYQKRSSVMIV